MLIKLTKVMITTVGSPPRVDQTHVEPHWINPVHIISAFITDQLHPCERLTTVCIGNGSFKVLETPEQINQLIKESK